MILILSNEYDETALSIIKYLNKVDYFIINELTIDAIKVIPINKLKIIYVKSSFNFSNGLSNIELQEIKDFLHYLYKKKNVVFYGENFTADFSKEEYLIAAQECGIAIPDYLYTNNRYELSAFVENHTEIITKSIKSQVKFIYADQPEELFSCYTKKLTIKDLDEIPGNFFPSFFQKLIHKDYELKIFYFDGKFYPGLLRSNDTDNTDIRSDIHATPLPVYLDKTLENKLLLLINKLRLNIATIDIIHGLDNNYYFLEINPSGQFGYISTGCNYNLEKVVADKFLEYYN